MRWNPVRAARPACLRGRPFRPRLETLEDRTVPSVDGLPAITGPAVVDEQAPYVLQLDPGSQVVDHWIINWGDGFEETVAGNASSASHVYDDGPAGQTITAVAFPRANLALTFWSPASGGNGHYYALSSSLSSWTTAESEAVSFGGHLVSINSLAEQDFLVSTFLSGANDRKVYWIGINDAAVEGTFVWSDGSAVTYTNWASGEPNNFRGNEDYGTINWHYGNNVTPRTKGAWNDTPVNGSNANASGPQPLQGIMEFTTQPLSTPVTRTLSLQVTNVAPTAAVAGPESGQEGETLTFLFSADDVSGADVAAGFDYAIDWEGDGFVDLTLHGGSNLTLSHVFDDQGTYSVTVRVTDRDGGVSEAASLSVVVANVAPTVAATGPAGGVRGQQLLFDFSAGDVSGADLAAGFDYAIDWDGDGTVDETIHGGASLSVAHAFTSTGDFTVIVYALDKDGGRSASASVSVQIVAAAVQNDPETAARTLLVGGTAGDDVIVLSRNCRTGSVEVWINGVRAGVFTDFEEIEVRGHAGNDVISLTQVRQPARVYGGAGNDVLVAGYGSALLFGESGDDVLIGGVGNDVLVGGEGDDVLLGIGGRDVLIGGGGRDILLGGGDLMVAGATAYDSDLRALKALRDEWSARRPPAVRLANLRDGSGSADRRNGNVFLDPATLLADRAADRVFAIGRKNGLFLSSEDRRF